MSGIVDTGGIVIQGHLIIRDPDTGEVFVNKSSGNNNNKKKDKENQEKPSK